MADLGKYRELGVQMAVAPSVDYADLKTQAQGYNQLSSALDRIANFAFKEAAEQAQIEGARYGAETAPTGQQMLDAINAGRDIELPGDTRTYFGKAARKSSLTAVSSDLELIGREAIINLQVRAEAEKMTPTQFAAETNAVLGGLGASIAQADPAIARQLRASLGVVGNSAYLAVSKEYIKRERDKERVALAAQADSAIDTIPTIVAGGDTVAADGTVIAAGTKLQAIKVQGIRAYQRIGDVEGAKVFIKAFDDRVQKSREDYMSRWAADSSTPAAARLALITRGQVDPNTDAGKVFNALGADQGKLRDAALKGWTNQIELGHKLEDQAERSKKNESKAAWVTGVNAVSSGDNKTAQDSLAILEENGDGNYDKLLKLMSGGVMFDNREVVDNLRREQNAGRLTTDVVVMSRTLGYLTDKTYKEFMDDARVVEEKNIESVVKEARARLGVPEASLVNPSAQQRLAQKTFATFQAQLIRAARGARSAGETSFDAEAFLDNTLVVLRDKGEKAAFEGARKDVADLAKAFSIPADASPAAIKDELEKRVVEKGKWFKKNKERVPMFREQLDLLMGK